MKNKLLYTISILLIAGCLITCDTGRTGEKLPAEVTFNEHIATIIHTHCSPCHRPGEAGPFNLISYKDVKKRTKMVRKVTADRYMPPWPADRSYRSFLNEKGLSDHEIALIAKWVKQDAPEGDPALSPEAPKFPESSQLGEPDLVLKMEKPFKIEGNNLDHFMMMKIPYELPFDTFVRAIEFVPGNRALAHHMNGHLIQYAEGAKKDVFEGEYVLNTEEEGSKLSMFEKMKLANDDGTYPVMVPSVCNYLPGVINYPYPEGIGGFYLNRKGAMLMDNMHYGPTAVDQYDQSQFNIFFGEKPPERPTREFQLGTSGLSEVVPPLVIPPGKVMTFRTEYVLDRDISLLTINPHMHLLGKAFLAFAVEPNGDTIPLIRIPEWDFRWQYFYTFEKIQPLFKGTRIVVEGTYDNTAENPNNPFDPPQTISERDGSMRTTDEMFQFIVTYISYKKGDEEISLDTGRDL